MPGHLALVFGVLAPQKVERLERNFVVRICQLFPLLLTQILPRILIRSCCFCGFCGPLQCLLTAAVSIRGPPHAALLLWAIFIRKGDVLGLSNQRRVQTGGQQIHSHRVAKKLEPLHGLHGQRLLLWWYHQSKRWLVHEVEQLPSNTCDDVGSSRGPHGHLVPLHICIALACIFGSS